MSEIKKFTGSSSKQVLQTGFVFSREKGKFPFDRFVNLRGCIHFGNSHIMGHIPIKIPWNNGIIFFSEPKRINHTSQSPAATSNKELIFLIFEQTL